MIRSSMPPIPIIWFDGMHRAWKWTHIDLAARYLERQWVRPVIAKGSWTRMGRVFRKGDWTDTLYDPPSEWWNEQYYMLKQQQWKEALREWWRSAFERMTRELHVLLERTLQQELSAWSRPVVCLFDRTWISEYFFEIQQAQWSIDDISLYETVRTKSIQPSLHIVLHPHSPHILLDRMDEKEWQTIQWAFRKNNIEQHFWLFDSMLKDMEKENDPTIEILDAWKSIALLHSSICEKIDTILYDILEWDGNSISESKMSSSTQWEAAFG